MKASPPKKILLSPSACCKIKGNCSIITCIFLLRDFFSGGNIMKKVTVATVKCFPVTSMLLTPQRTRPDLVCFILCLCLYLTLCESSVISAVSVLGFFAGLVINNTVQLRCHDNISLVASLLLILSTFQHLRSSSVCMPNFHINPILCSDFNFIAG